MVPYYATLHMLWNFMLLCKCWDTGVIISKELILCSDHEALKHIIEQKKLNPWLHKLENYL